MTAAAQDNWATASLPGTPPGKRLEAWLAAVNSADLSTIEFFLAEALTPAALKERPAEARALSRLRLRMNAGRFAVWRVLAATGTHVEALLRSDLADEWWRLRVDVEPLPPHRIAHLTIHPAPEPEEARERGDLTDAGAATRLEALAGKLAGADVFSGAVLLARDGVTLTACAFGDADKARGIPNRVDTVFNVGSVNKTMTAVAVAQLVEEGHLSFSDTVGKHLPGWPNAEVRERVTIHHLLTHTAGLGTYFNPRFRAAEKTRFRAVDDYDCLYAADAPAFAPGARFSYSNSGFMLLGKILEAVTGEDFYAYMRRRVFGPARMESTGFFALDEEVPDRATGYTRRDAEGIWGPGPRRSNRSARYLMGSPGGGADSTVTDLLRFDQALRSGTLLHPESLSMLWTPHVATDFDASVRHGYGFFLETVEGCRIAYHTGIFAGVNAHFEMHLDTGHTLAILSNYDPPAATRLALKARSWLVGTD